jgi:uncharacterized membrane protein HdeD (DUF308 family)
MTDTPSSIANHLLKHNWGWLVVRGVMALLLGVIALLAPGLTLFVFALFFAAFSFIDGVAQVIAGVRGAQHHAERYGALIFYGIVGIVIGVLFIVWPLMSTMVYAYLVIVLIGLWAIATGIFELAAAVRLRREIKGEWLLGLSGLASLILGAGLLVLSALNPGVTVFTVSWLIAFYAFVSGVALIVLGIRMRRAVG